MKIYAKEQANFIRIWYKYTSNFITRLKINSKMKFGLVSNKLEVASFKYPFEIDLHLVYLIK